MKRSELKQIIKECLCETMGEDLLSSITQALNVYLHDDLQFAQHPKNRSEKVVLLITNQFDQLDDVLKILMNMKLKIVSVRPVLGGSGVGHEILVKE